MTSVPLALALLALPAVLRAAVPATINHQGYLTNTSGQPIDGSVNMAFYLCTTSDCSAYVWSETYLGVPVTKGVYNVMLGSVSSLANIAFDTQYYLGVQVGTDAVMTPAQPLASAAYARRAGSVQLSNVSTCTAATAGTLRWTGTAFEGCDGTSWVRFVMEDVTANQFTFSDQTGVGLGTQVTSDAIVVAGISVPVGISITACSSSQCEYSINSRAYVSTPGTVFPGDAVTVRQIASATELTTTDLTLGIGGVADTFSVTAGLFGNGSSQVSAGETCQWIVQNFPASSTGLYWIDPDAGSKSNAYQAYCDMTTDGGGWTLWASMTSSGAASTGTIQTSSNSYMDQTRYAALQAASTNFMARGQTSGNRFYLSKTEALTANCQTLVQSAPYSASGNLAYGYRDSSACGSLSSGSAYLLLRTNNTMQVYSNASFGLWHPGSLAGNNLNLNTTQAEARTELYLR